MASSQSGEDLSTLSTPRTGFRKKLRDRLSPSARKSKTLNPVTPENTLSARSSFSRPGQQAGVVEEAPVPADPQPIQNPLPIRNHNVRENNSNSCDVVPDDSQNLPHDDRVGSPELVPADQLAANIPPPTEGLDTRASIPTASPGVILAESTVQDASEPEIRPIREVWDEAYEDLRAENENLVKKYEKILRGSLHGAIASITSPIAGKVRRAELMKTVVEQKLAQYKKDAWKVQARGETFLVKDMAKNLAGIIKWLDKYVGGALRSNPTSGLAWAGVMVFVPMILNPSEQAEALYKGLDSICNILVRSAVRENLYFERWERNADRNDRSRFMPMHKDYRDTLKALYTSVLKYQLTSVCYFAKNGGLRTITDLVKWDDWEGLLKDIKTQDESMRESHDLLNDVKTEEEFEKLEKRHAEWVDIWRSGFGEVSALRKSIEAAQHDSKRTELLSWLSSVDPSVNYNNARSKHENGGKGTGDWLIQENEDFDRWKVAPNSLMWLNGKAGSGKSVLSSSVIHHLKKSHDGDPRVALAYFYFSFNDEQKQTVEGMIESIIKQICCCRPDTPLSLEALEDLKARGHRPDLETLQNVLAETVGSFSRVYVVVDALDECPNLDDGRDRLLMCLNTTHQKAFNNLHMLWTSRREKDIETSYNELISDSEIWDINLSTHRQAIDDDIGLFIDSNLALAPYKSWPEDLKVDARKDLIEKSDGMFQYISCQFEALKPLLTRPEIRKALKELPEGLDATYDRMLARVSSKKQKQVARVLEWLSFSLRPLLLEEIAEIYILDPEAEMPFDEDNRLMDLNSLLNILSGLVTEVPRHLDYFQQDHYARHDTDVIEIRLAHFSIKEYLISNRISSDHCSMFRIEEIAAHIHITESCLAYHLHLSQTTLATEENLQQFQLWEFVVKYWPKHLDIIPEGKCTPTVKEGALQTFARGSQSQLNMARIRDPDSGGSWPVWSMTADKLVLPLYHACAIGALKVAEFLIGLDEGSTIDDISPNGRWGTALQVASYQRHDVIVQILVKAGADVNAQGGELGNALQAATFTENEEIVQILLEKGVDVNAQGGYFGNALQAAARGENEKMVQILLEKGADVNAQNGYYRNALQAAAVRGNENIVQILLEKGADVNAQGGEYGNALQAATFTENEEIVKILLEKGVDVNAQGGKYGNALQAAAYSGNEKIVQILLEKGADVNTQGGEFGNALQAAAIKGNEKIVQILLEKGADVNAQGGQYGDALQAAVAWSRWEIAKLLLLKGAEVTPPGRQREEVLASVGTEETDRLRAFWEEPTIEGLAKVWKEDEEKEAEERRAAWGMDKNYQSSDTEASTESSDDADDEGGDDEHQQPR